jgi:hypothetical protein
MDLTQVFVDLLQRIIEAGGEPPFYLVTVAINGSMLYARYCEADGVFDCDVLAESYNEKGFNMMFVDASGEAYRALVGRLSRVVIAFRHRSVRLIERRASRRHLLVGGKEISVARCPACSCGVLDKQIRLSRSAQVKGERFKLRH